MQLSHLLQNLKHTTTVDLNTEITGITDDSRKVQPGNLFLAVNGSVSNGNQYIDSAIKSGAAAVVTSESHQKNAAILVENDMEARATIGKNYFAPNLNSLKLCGITGTNGKTTTSSLINFTLAQKNKTALLGTIQNVIHDKVYESALTTPGILDLYDLIHQCNEEQVSHLTMEVSSHALHQKRVHGLEFDVAVFTNLSQDHLDYHPDMDHYFESKALLFTNFLKSNGISIVNLDCAYGQRLSKLVTSNIITYSKDDSTANAYITSRKMENNFAYLELRFKEDTLSIKTPLLGKFNEENILSAVCGLKALGCDNDLIESSFPQFTIPGRMEQVSPKESIKIFIDYAHTPDALERVLRNSKEITEGSLKVVFGCGGDRDNSKRKIMGQVSNGLADEIFVTSDNPRTEDPEQILDHIFEGISHPKVHRITDRRVAIKRAIASLQNKDTLIIAGKGHEDYQIIGTEKFPFDDKKISQEYMEELWN